MTKFKIMLDTSKESEMPQCVETSVISRFLVIKEYSEMTCKIGETIELPSKDWVYADGTFCSDDFFKNWTDIFQRVNGL
jgi:hypothetical protein